MAADDEINFVECYYLIKKKKKIFFSIILSVFILGILITFLTKPNFRAKSSFFFPYSSKGMGGISKVLEGLDPTDLLGGKSLISMSNYSISILKSRTISDNILDKYGERLLKGYRKMKRVKQVEALKKNVKIELNKDKIIEISITSKDPDLSAEVANAYLDEYEKFNDNSILSYYGRSVKYSKQQRDFYKGALLKTEEKLRKYQESHEVLDIPEEAKNMIKYFADIKLMKSTSVAQSVEANKRLEVFKQKLKEQTAESEKQVKYPLFSQDPSLHAYYEELTLKEVELMRKKESLTDKHPEIQKIHESIGELKGKIKSYIADHLKDINSNLTAELINAQMQAISSKSRDDALTGMIKDVEIRMNKMPTLGMGYGRLLRDVKVYNEIYKYWEMEYQKSLSEKSKDPTDYQILDKATPPDAKCSPTISINLAISLVFGLVLALCIVFGMEFIERQKKSYLQKLKLQMEEKHQG